MKTEAIRVCIDVGECEIGTKLAIDAKAELEAIEKENAVMIEHLLDHEWSRYGNCPVCGDVGPAETDHPSTTYHSDICWLGNAIKASKEADEKEPMMQPD